MFYSDRVLSRNLVAPAQRRQSHCAAALSPRHPREPAYPRDVPGKRANGAPDEHGLSIRFTVTENLNAGRKLPRSGIARRSNTGLPIIHAA